MFLGPVSARPKDTIVKQKKARKLLPRASEVLHGQGARMYQIPHRFVTLVRNPHRCQFTRAVQAGEQNGITPIGLDTITRSRGPQRGRNKRAIMPNVSQVPMNAVSARPSFIAKMQRGVSFREFGNKPP